MNPSDYSSAAKAELAYPGDLSAGQNEPGVQRVQEWLTLHGTGVAIDGKFGTATAHALRLFQRDNAIPETGKLDQATWTALVEPMNAALQTASGSNFLARVEGVARQHLKAEAREAGGDNRGPWVRLYCDGRDGTEWKWCGGFITFVMKQAAAELGLHMPLPGSLSCDTLAAQAQKSGRFVSGSDITSGKVSWSKLDVSYVFLVKRTDSDWSHTGFGFRGEPDHFDTLEGNTNDGHSTNGYEVAAGVRAANGKDFIVIHSP